MRKDYAHVIRYISSCPILRPYFHPHIYGTTAVRQFVMLPCPSCEKECANCQALANRHWKFVYQLDVLLPLSMVPLLLSFGGVRALSPLKLGGDVDTMSPNKHV